MNFSITKWHAARARKNVSETAPPPPAGSLRRPHWSLHTFVPFTTLALFLDSAWLQGHVLDGQWLANILTAIYFAAMLRTLDDPPLQRMMWLAVLISAAGEIIGSLFLEVWIYRNGYVPLYVPLGHAIVIGSGFQILRYTGLERHRRAIITAGGGIYCGLIVGALVLWGDSFSAALGVLLTVLLLIARNRLLYMFMPIPVLFVELVGTAFGCWHWPTAPFGLLSTTNPPVGSIALYVVLDMSVLLAVSRWNEARRGAASISPPTAPEA